MVIERYPEYTDELREFLSVQREHLMMRLEKYDDALREDFAEIDTILFTPTYDDCVELLKKHSAIR